MKRLLFGFLLFASVCTCFADSSVAWEGRAAIGSRDAFPFGGNYAQSRVFAKGEIVEVYNVSNGKIADVVITGTSELSGVLMLLSPLAAENLALENGYDTVVRVSRKNDYVKTDTLLQENPTKIDNSALEIAQNASTPASTVQSPLSSSFYLDDDTVAQDESAILALANDTTEETYIEENLASSTNLDANDTQNAETFAQNDTENLSVDNSMQEENTLAMQIDANAQNIAKEENVQNDTITDDTNLVSNDASTSVATNSTNVHESVYTYSTLPETPVQDKNATRVVIASSTDKNDANANNANVTKDEKSTNNATSTNKPAVNASNATSTSSASNTSLQKAFPYPELLISDYEKGKYYIQLVVCRDAENIKPIVSKYRYKYPVSIKKSERIADGYEILIGPVFANEYNELLAKFRKDGYKDAFVKFKKNW